MIDSQVASAALAPALWLLARAEDGIALTQTGALNRARVRQVVERWPGWRATELFGPPNREDEVTLLRELHALLRRLRLVRPAGRRIVTTAHGRKLCDDPPALLAALAAELLCGESFTAACGELPAALMLDGAVADYSDALATRIHPAIVAEGWQSAGEHPSSAMSFGRSPTSCAVRSSIGLLEREPRLTRHSPNRLVLAAAASCAPARWRRPRDLTERAKPAASPSRGDRERAE